MTAIASAINSIFRAARLIYAAIIEGIRAADAKKTNDALNAVERAKTEKEYQDAARDLARSISKR